MKISILSTVHNEERYLSSMLDSIRAQDHRDWEVVLVDDGSTDATRDIIRRYARMDRRIVMVPYKGKLGKVAAFNAAYRHSSGAVVGLLAGDDLLPEGSLRKRLAPFADLEPTCPTVAYFKLRVFSGPVPLPTDLVVPRGSHGSRSGPSVTMNRRLADLVFPLPEELASDDPWIGEVSAAYAAATIESSVVVVNYRIHGGNSNPRNRSFEEMNEALHERAAAWASLLATDVPLAPSRRRQLEALDRAEQSRYAGKTLEVLSAPGVGIRDRLALAAHSSHVLFAARKKCYRLFSGWRGR